jgi:hypothetical protein
MSLLPVNKYIILKGNPPPVVHTAICTVNNTQLIKMKTLHMRYRCLNDSLSTTELGIEGCGGTAYTDPHIPNPHTTQR